MLKVLTACALLVTGTSVWGQPQDQPQRARARFIAERPDLVPGTTAWLSVAFDIDKDWHLYWNGYSDTGFPIKLTPAFPDGYTLGTVQWPAPSRHITQDFVDHVYEGRVALLLPVQVPANAKIGEKVTFQIEAEWLVCKQACLPGDVNLSLTLPIAAVAGEPGPDAKAFAETRANLPKALDAAKPEVLVDWRESEVRITAADHAKKLAFYPALDSAKLENLQTQGATETGTLTLSLDKPGAASRLVGVVEVWPASGSVRRVFAIDSARTPLNPGKAGASNPKQPTGG